MGQKMYSNIKVSRTTHKMTILCGKVRKIKMENNNWTSVSSGLYPDDMEDVQVTFIGYNDHAPHCEAFAYRNEGKWYWSLDDSDVNVEITAWKHNCEPYDGK